MDLKSLLLSGSRLAEDTVDIPGVGKVRVRGLSRQEVSDIGAAIRAEELDSDAIEARYLAAGMVEPVLSVDEAVAWRQSAPSGEVNDVVNRIFELSGLIEGAAKSDL